MIARGMWMLEDLEPWPDAPTVGAVFAPTTYWSQSYGGQLPAEVIVDQEVDVESRTTGGRVEWVADLGLGLSTMLRPGQHAPGRVTLRGCLMWDRYLWLDYRTEPAGMVRLLDRPGHIVQRETLTPTAHPGRFAVSYDGTLRYCDRGSVPEGFGIRLNVLRIEPVSAS